MEELTHMHMDNKLNPDALVNISMQLNSLEKDTTYLFHISLRSIERKRKKQREE